MNEFALKQAIEQNLRQFASQPLGDAALQLFTTLGYRSDKRFPLIPNTAANFLANFEQHNTLNQEQALFKQWRSVDFLFQLTDDEIRQDSRLALFTSQGVWDNARIESYLLFAIELADEQYTRSQLASITRAVNRLFAMPALLLFKHGPTITLAVINRRLHKRDDNKDVLEKVTLIKDIRFAEPHRAHLEILFDLALEQLASEHPIHNWVELHRAWQKTLDTKELNKRFYRELSNWYFWALQEVTFPGGAIQADKTGLFQEEDKVREHNAKNLIRLLTRILFVWFVKEKKLIPDELFHENYIKEQLLNDFEPRKKRNFDYKTHGSKYYRAILQNLFFATLNQTVGKREFRKDGQHRNVTNLMRYKRYFKNPEAFLTLMEETVPFMNGGLFECLDAPDPHLKGKSGGDVILYEDGFSDHPDNILCVPDYIFFGMDEHADLSEELGDKKQKNVSVTGLIHILKAYKFTVSENTPIEEDVALDPELLGQVFENLLASYNPETKTTARKQTGSFYTPREIVNYMVDESIKAYLKQKLVTEAGMTAKDAETGLEFLVGYNEKEHLFDEEQTTILINAIDSCKILDPACGSGAFPMGILHKLVHILHKLDLQNEQWKERQIEKAMLLDDATIRDNLIEDIETAFANNELDYGRKLYLIENCIYGVDIQPIAIQISKLRFFISLVVDQKADRAKPNFGIRPLPNLETKFVAANTLIAIEKPPTQMALFDNQEVKNLEEKLKDVRHRLFSAKTPPTKRKLRDEDKDLREEMRDLLIANGWGNASAHQLAKWDPYNQNIYADFFDPEWMFGVSDGFDVMIGNPPYVRPHKLSADYKEMLWKLYKSFEKKADLYCCFIERAIEMLKQKGKLAFIISNGFLRLDSFEQLRKLLLQQTTIQEITDFEEDVFESAVVKTCIIILSKMQVDNYLIRTSQTRNITQLQSLPIKYIPQIEFHSTYKSIFDLSIDEQSNALKTKIRNSSVTLESLFDIAFGLKTGDDSRFLTFNNTSAECKPLLRGENITRYSYQFTGEYVWYVPSAMVAHRSTARPGTKERFEQPKVLVRDTGGGLICLYDQSNFYVKDVLIVSHKGHLPTVLKALTGLLNSSLMKYYYESSFPTLHVQRDELASLPVTSHFSNNVQAISRVAVIVDHIQSAKISNPVANVSVLEAEIDRLAYQLYGLTDDEIAIIEAKK